MGIYIIRSFYYQTEFVETKGTFFIWKFIVMIIMWYYYYVKPVMQQIKSSLDLSHSLWESVNIFQNIFSLFCRTTLCYWKTTLWAFFLRLLVCTTLYRFVSYFLYMLQSNCFHSTECCIVTWLLFVVVFVYCIEAIYYVNDVLLYRVTSSSDLLAVKIVEFILLQ